jgi:signal transduction histidine kinase
MADWLQQFFTTRGLPPHGYCLLWDPKLIWTHVLSDAAIGLAYFSIPVVLATLLARRRDIAFGWVGWLFAAFILLCGTTHFLSILVLWVPAYGLEGLVKAVTAVVSVVTAIALWPLLPKIVALPSPRQLQQANESLRAEASERERTEEMLRQSQKLEAIGQLTGGIAHDFNNLLMVVVGNLDRVMRSLPDEAAERRNLDNALAATERAAQLTDQLLTFARRQPVQVCKQNCSDIVLSLAGMIERTIGSNIELTLDIGPDMLFARIDRNQLENAVLNLAINARDAMPDGGDLTIATRRGDDGGAVISLSDTGMGMDAETLRRATEPFFTTKPVGQGTGLGLSQVYGFVEQMGGNMGIFSAAGTGTVVVLSFPPSEGG